MSLSDPIADMLTRIRNAVRISDPTVKIKASKICEGIASVLKEEGFVADYDRIDDGQQGIIKVHLKYSIEGEPAIGKIQRFSKPGCRKYAKVDEIPEVMAGMGIAIVSTSKGVLSDRRCRNENIGGEVLCTVST